MKKILNWLFRNDLELNKKWWHRLVKVTYFIFFGLITVGFFIAIFVEPYSDYFLNHNVNKVTLKEYSKNYKGPETDNTLYKFIQERDDFGIVLNGELVDKYLYLSDYTFEKGSFCLKNPVKYLDWIKKITIEKANEEAITKWNKAYGLTEKEKEDLGSKIDKAFENNSEINCFLYTNDSDLKNLDSIQDSIAILKPNYLYYLELVVGLIMTAFLGWIISALAYYKLIIYIIFGSRK